METVFHMRYMTCARTVSPLTPAAPAGDKQSQAIRATASCDRLVALGSFPRGTGFSGAAPKDSVSLLFAAPAAPSVLLDLGWCPAALQQQQLHIPFPPPVGAALPALLPGWSGEWARLPPAPEGWQRGIEQKSLPRHSYWAYHQLGLLKHHAKKCKYTGNRMKKGCLPFYGVQEQQSCRVRPLVPRTRWVSPRTSSFGLVMADG